MKTTGLFFALLLAICLATPSFAQFSIGPRVAANFANVAGEDSDGESVDTDSRFGMAFGAAFEIGITEMFAIQPEVLFSQQGFKLTEEIFDDNLEQDVNLNYIQVPILVKVKFGAEPVGFNVFAGPHIGLGIGDVKTEATFAGETEESKDSWKDLGLKTFDFGLTGGAGVSVPLGPGTIGLDVRYQFGLANYFDDPEEDEFIKNRNFQIGLSYLIMLGGK